MSIANSVSQVLNVTDLRQYILETDFLAHTIAEIVNNRPEAASYLAKLLLVVRQELASNSPRRISAVVNTLDQAVELAFLESNSYRQALDAWIETQGGRGGDLESARSGSSALGGEEEVGDESSEE